MANRHNTASSRPMWINDSRVICCIICAFIVNNVSREKKANARAGKKIRADYTLELTLNWVIKRKRLSTGCFLWIGVKWRCRKEKNNRCRHSVLRMIRPRRRTLIYWRQLIRFCFLSLQEWRKSSVFRTSQTTATYGECSSPSSSAPCCWCQSVSRARRRGATATRRPFRRLRWHSGSSSPRWLR